ncbi:protein kinase domain-containing protein [Dactylosporangium sp. CS-033363]|uniref:serine/threonine-protein kinase n=1 Tax=Dactylosporangium sp. CS-033363 TaxID=3239935 RepID=UPI003D8EB702
MTAAPPVVADRYRLLEPLGVGGMGRVWRARDETLHRDVAVKQIVLPPELLDSARDVAMERTLREARAAARLSHPNVVRVYDVLAAEGQPWLVMEYVRSRSLDQVIREDGPLPPRRVAEIGLAVLDALRAAHRAGVDHRDIKPGNVLLAEDGRVVLTDFGIARVEGEGHVTRTGLVLGSPEFIAPERAREGIAGPAGDLWSLGATLYAAVEGRSPFGRGSAMETLSALASEEADPPQRAGALTPALRALLRKDPKARADFAQTDELLRRALLRPEQAKKKRSWLGGWGRTEQAAPAVPAQRTPTRPERPIRPIPAIPPVVAPPAAGSVYSGASAVRGKAVVPPPAAAPAQAERPVDTAVSDKSGVIEGPVFGTAAADEIEDEVETPAATAPADVETPAATAPADVETPAATAPADVETPVETPVAANANVKTADGNETPVGNETAATNDTAVGSETAAASETAAEEPATAAPATETESATWTPRETAEPEAPAKAEPETATETATEEEPAEEPETKVEPLAPVAVQRGAEPVAAVREQPKADTAPQTRIEARSEPRSHTRVAGSVAPVVAPPKRTQDEKRRRGILIGSVAAVVVAALLVWFAVSTDDDGNGDKQATGTNQTTAAGAAPAPSAAATSQAGGGAAPTTGAPSNPPATSSTPQKVNTASGTLPPLPAGWIDYHDETGFSVYMPAGWKKSFDGPRIYFRGNGRTLGIDQTNDPQPDPVADWKAQEKDRGGSYYKNYTGLGIRKVDNYFVAAADWEFTYSNGPQHVNNRGIVTSDHQAYGIWWSTSESDWSGARGDLDIIFASFRPKP